jgi:hypothetical protein
MAEEIGKGTSITHNVPTMDDDDRFRTESLTVAQFFADFNDSPQQDLIHTTCLDVGGGTSDISIWQDNHLVHQASVPYAGRDLFHQILQPVLKPDVHFIDEIFAARLQKGEELLTIKNNMVLVEISFVSPPRELNHVIFDMVTGGYQPILAHPERYAYYHHQKDIYEQFKHQGCLLQVNMLSLIGYYGKQIQDTAIYLAKNGMIDLVGTDLHHGRHLAELQSPDMIEAVQDLLGRCTLLNDTL